MADIFLPKEMTIQWHLTKTCNLKCLHCYQNERGKSELSLDELVSVFIEIRKFIQKYRCATQFNLTGGEPLLRNDFIDLLTVIRHYFSNADINILSNGLLVDNDTAKKLKDFEINAFQVSLEGGKEINNRIRGNNTYERLSKKVDILRKHNIPVTLSFTLSSENLNEFENAIAFAKQHDIRVIWFDRMVPIGTAMSSDLSKRDLSKNDIKAFFQRVSLLRKAEQRSNSELYIRMHRALQFLDAKDEPIYRCTAGRNIMTIMSNGDLVPCRRMPIVMGNLLNESLINLYENKLARLKMLDYDSVAEGCEECEYKLSCGGGAKCLSYALYGNAQKKDPHCYHLDPKVSDDVRN